MKEVIDNMAANINGDVICVGEFGSHLYGLNTADSDRDYKGIYIPTQKDLLLGKAKNTIKYTTGSNTGKNTAEDVDIDLHSLVSFVRDACKGETYAIDMLHMPHNEVEDTLGSVVWASLKRERTKFYSKNMKSLIGYARKQAAKYGIKGSRVEFLEQCLLLLEKVPNENKLWDCWEALPVGEFAEVTFDSKSGFHWWEVCGKKFSNTTPIYLVVDSLQKMYEGYGHRAQQAKENKGVDWKAVSHALRACYQMKDIFKFGDFSYPLLETSFLMKVKQGELDFLTEVQPELEFVIKEVETLSQKSNLPEKIDVDYWEDWVYHCLKIYYQ